MKTETGIFRIQLQIKYGGFDGLLFFAGEFGKAAGEGVYDTEVHADPSALAGKIVFK